MSDGKWLQAMLKCVAIERVVYVDDLFALNADAFAAAARSNLSKIERGELAGLSPEDAKSAPARVIDQQLRKTWREANEDDKSRLAAKVDTTQRSRAASRLIDLLEGDDHERLSKAQWEERKTEIIAQCEETPTLVLFDRNFANEGGGAKDGDRMLAEFQEAAGETRVWSALITGEIPSSDHHQAWREISDGPDVDPTRFALLLKDELRDDESKFKASTRVALMAPLARQLMKIVSKTASDATEDATKYCEALEPLTFEQIVFETSAIEGASVTETLMRIHRLAQQPPSYMQLAGSAEANQLVQQIRCLGDHHPQRAEADDGDGDDEKPRRRLKATPQAVQLEQWEVYEDAEDINKRLLPVRLGDIFSKENGTKTFVLVGAPCDLAVRPSGKRAPELAYAVMAEIFDNLESGTDNHRYFELPSFNMDGSSAFADMARTHFTTIRALDFCAVNESGRSRLTIGESPSETLRPAWRELYKRAQKDASSLGELLEGLDGKQRKVVLAGWSGGKSQLFPPKLEGNHLSYGIKRVRRLSRYWANALLLRHSKYLTRDAHEHRLTRVETRADA